MFHRFTLSSCLLLLIACERRNTSPGWLVDAGGADSTVATDSADVDATTTTDASCAAISVGATLDRAPVDLIWVVDNSSSMGPSVEELERGINNFASYITASGLDYRVIMLSMRRRRGVANPDPDTGAVTRNGDRRFPVCVPQPLAGPNCADGERFFQIDVDVLSSQPVEQVLGTLAQTTGYRAGNAAGGAPWRQLLRENSVKSFVFVTDDNARVCGGTFSCQSNSGPRMTELSLENYPGGSNPFTSDVRALGAGVRTNSYGDLFRDYVVNAIYGYSNAQTPDVPCRFSPNEPAANSGTTYTALIEHTMGVRARICDVASAWDPFLRAVSERTAQSARVACEVEVPVAPEGLVFIESQVNVHVRGRGASFGLRRVANAEACSVGGGWFYQSDASVEPRVIALCPTTCETARREISGPNTGLDISFGCETLLQ